MADTTYSRWYREGSVTVAQNSKTVQGANTYWLNANIKPGDLFTIDSSKFYEVDTIDSNTQITLRTNFEEAKITAGAYKIIRNFTATLAAETAAKVVEVLARNERYVNEDMKTVQGYSAYDLACQGGFVGTLEEWLASLTAYGVARSDGFSGSKEDWLTSLTAYGVAVSNGYKGDQAQWLEDLKAAEEWTTLNNRTEILTYHNAATHNAQHRGKYLGTTITSAQSNAIRSGTFADIYPGDYWESPAETEYTYTDYDTGEEVTKTLGEKKRWTVMDCDYAFGTGTAGTLFDLPAESTTTRHSILVMPTHSHLGAFAMCAEGETNSIGYQNSTFRKKHLRKMQGMIHGAFDSSHIGIFRMTGCTGVNQSTNTISAFYLDLYSSSKVCRSRKYPDTQYGWLDIELPTLGMILGFPTALELTKFGDGGTPSWSRQLAFFRHVSENAGRNGWGAMYTTQSPHSTGWAVTHYENCIVIRTTRGEACRPFFLLV